VHTNWWLLHFLTNGQWYHCEQLCVTVHLLHQQAAFSIRAFVHRDAYSFFLILLSYEETLAMQQPFMLGTYESAAHFVSVCVCVCVCAHRGFIYMLFFSKWLLPDSEATSLHDEVLVGLQVPKGSRHTGRTGTRRSARF